MFWWSTPAQAQSLLQQLFGLSPAPQARQMPTASRMAAPQPVTSSPIYVIQRGGRSNWDGPPAPEGSGSYTTVCVRMCDGFHFPVSYRVPRSRFHRDADICRSRCGMTDAQLFYHPSSGSNADMNSAVDLTGRSYARLPIAFLHRKKLVAGCGCRPEAWSQASLIRHEGYAVAAGMSVAGLQVAGAGRPTGTLSVVAGNYPATSPLRETPVDARTDNGSSSPASSDASAGPDALQRPDTNDAIPTAVIPVRSTGNVRVNARSGQVASRKNTSARSFQRSANAVHPARKSANVVMASSGKYVWPGDAPTRTR